MCVLVISGIMSNHLIIDMIKNCQINCSKSSGGHRQKISGSSNVSRQLYLVIGFKSYSRGWEI